MIINLKQGMFIRKVKIIEYSPVATMEIRGQLLGGPDHVI